MVGSGVRCFFCLRSAGWQAVVPRLTRYSGSWDLCQQQQRATKVDVLLTSLPITVFLGLERDLEGLVDVCDVLKDMGRIEEPRQALETLPSV